MVILFNWLWIFSRLLHKKINLLSSPLLSSPLLFSHFLLFSSFLIYTYYTYYSRNISFCSFFTFLVTMLLMNDAVHVKIKNFDLGSIIGPGSTHWLYPYTFEQDHISNFMLNLDPSKAASWMISKYSSWSQNLVSIAHCQLQF